MFDSFFLSELTNTHDQFSPTSSHPSNPNYPIRIYYSTTHASVDIVMLLSA